MTTNYTVGRIIPEDTEATSTNFNTTAVTFSAKKFFEYFLLPEELNEDSAPPILAIARQEVAEAVIRAYERAILDGDTTGTHMDSDVTASTDARKAFMGLRKKALANSANGSVVDFGSAVTYPKLMEMRAAGGISMVNPKELAWILGPAGYNQAIGLDQVVTVDKAGPMATLMSGSLASIAGSPIITSQFIRENLNASGVYDGVTTDNTTCLLVNVRRFMLGMRRPIRIKAQRDARPEFDRWQLVSYSRMGFNGAPQGASEVSVVVGVNVTV
jgi:HK97 family phage major capsid protein